jgi:hypothetical protein
MERSDAACEWFWLEIVGIRRILQPGSHGTTVFERADADRNIVLQLACSSQQVLAVRMLRDGGRVLPSLREDFRG